MKIIRAAIELLTDYSPERETKKAAHQTRLLLVDHKCKQEYYNASVPMLEKRLARLEAELDDAESGKAVRIHTHIQSPAPAQTFHPAFNFRRRAAQ
jgi:hypothetical protein